MTNLHISELVHYIYKKLENMHDIIIVLVEP